MDREDTACTLRFLHCGTEDFPKEKALRREIAAMEAKSLSQDKQFEVLISKLYLGEIGLKEAKIHCKLYLGEISPQDAQIALEDIRKSSCASCKERLLWAIKTFFKL